MATINYSDSRSNNYFRNKYNENEYPNVNNGMRRFENKYTQSNNEYIESLNDIKDNNYNNINYNTAPNFYKNYNIKTINDFNDYKNNNHRIHKIGRNPYYYNNNHYKNYLKYNDIDSENENKEQEEEYYHSGRRANIHYRNKSEKFFSDNIQNNNNDIMYNTEQNLNYRKKFNDNYFKNKINNSANLYQNTYTPKRKLLIYTQPNSSSLNNHNYINKAIKYKNSSIDNKYDNNNYGSRDNYPKNHNRYLRYNNGGVNRTIDILMGNY